MHTGGMRIGTSGWHYGHWVGPFYPPETPKTDLLRYYAEHFDTVEVDATFYSLPTADTVEDWHRTTPRDFLFACKASRYVTHMKKLREPEASTARLLDVLDGFGDKLGPILFQLPPRWHVDEARLEAFLEALPKNRRYAFELRDETWWTDRIYDLLERYGAALCIFDLAGHRSPVEITASFTYVRLHGPEEAYRGRYDGRTLFGWARRFVTWRKAGHDVFCYFDNDEAGHATEDAARLARMIANRRKHAGRQH
jgi:uncharacterized protein YecE (DUF72 family)